MNTTAFRSLVADSAARIAALGNWPGYIDTSRSLVDRVPVAGTTALGFDAGIAAALGLIPEDKQRLAAVLHAAYTEEAVVQVRTEAANLDPDSETCWWLAACSICREGEIDVEQFQEQVEAFELLVSNPTLRLGAAQTEFDRMKMKFNLIDGIPFAIEDGGMQGAYIVGHDFAVQYNEQYGLFFIGTFRPSLGLESFSWSNRKDNQERPMSGPVHGSKQFVKASSFGELSAALYVVQKTLGK